MLELKDVQHVSYLTDVQNGGGDEVSKPLLDSVQKKDAFSPGCLP